jgi:hypothetical protein
MLYGCLGVKYDSCPMLEEKDLKIDAYIEILDNMVVQRSFT